MNDYRKPDMKGGVALITLLFVTGLALTVVLTANSTTMSAVRYGRERLASDGAFYAAESGATDAVRALQLEPNLASLPDMTVGGLVASRTYVSGAGQRQIVSTASEAGAVAVVRAVCDELTGSCVIRRE